jgi:dihydroorotase
MVGRTMSSTLLQGGTVVNSDLETRDDVLLRDGTIEEIDTYVEEYDKAEDVAGMKLFPGFIDCHVHFREPGFEHKADMKSEAAAAFAGGVTTVCEMPNTNPPTVTVSAFADKVRRSENIENVDMRFFFGITQDIHLAAFLEMMNSTAEEMVRLRSRLSGVKIYLDHSTGNQKIETDLISDVFKACALHNVVLVAHCEDPETNAQAAAQNTRTNIAAHSLMRPAQSEVIMIERAIAIAKTHGTHLHIAHLSTEGGVELVKRAKAEGLKITCEVTPHHLFLTTDDYERLGTLGKMNPPLRSQKHRFALWQGIAEGTVDCISTDHAPHTLEEKRTGEELKAPSGVPGVETMIPLLLSVAGGHWPNPAEANAACPQLSYKDIVRLCMANPNKIFKLGKNELHEGVKTDIVVADSEEEWVIRGEELHSKCKWTPFEGWKVKGRVKRVIRAA